MTARDLYRHEDREASRARNRASRLRFPALAGLANYQEGAGEDEGLSMKKQGLYDPAFEHDACGVAFVARLDGSRRTRPSRAR